MNFNQWFNEYQPHEIGKINKRKCYSKHQLGIAFEYGQLNAGTAYDKLENIFLKVTHDLGNEIESLKKENYELKKELKNKKERFEDE